MPGPATSDEIQRQVARTRRHLHDHWKSYAIQGAVMIVAGVLALAVPLAATLASTIFFGWLMLLGGVVGLVSAFRARNAPGFWSNVALAALAVILGLVIVADPFAGAITLTWALAAYFLLIGFVTFSIANAVRVSKGRFALLVLSGILNIALALLVVLGLPGTAVWAIGVFLGISLLSSGLSLLLSALQARGDPPAR
ncbi:hypothetical protein ASG48_03095 [Aurantimonas sp. Leaf443]|nr:hypothetical protein ASG48_03095 [Aurantimonas sp. Leaf443]